VRQVLRSWTTIRRVFRRILADDVASAAASVAFFVLLAVFPGLAALISLVKLFSDSARIEAFLALVAGLAPPGSAEILARQVGRLTRMTASDEARRHALALTPCLGFAVLLWSSNKGTKALFRALNTIYDRKEERSFLLFTLLTLSFTLAALLFLVFALGLVVGIPIALDMLGPGGTWALALDVLRWPALLVVVGGAAAVIYRFGPSGRRWRSWRSVASGAFVAALLWIGGSALFSWFVSRFGRLDEVYGSLSAVIGFMVWIWLSAAAVPVGAEVDAAAQGSREREEEA
jgi:membrane protein